MKSEGVGGGKVWSYANSKNRANPQTGTLPSPILGLSLDIGFALISVVLTYFVVLKMPLHNYNDIFLALLIMSCGLAILIGIFCLISEGISYLFTKWLNLNKKNAPYLVSAKTFFIPYLILFCISFSVGIVVNYQDTSEIDNYQERASIYLDEYGYEDVEENVEGDTAAVTKKGGEEVTVNVMNYGGEVILYENDEQLKEKMSKVDAGTYMKEDIDE